MPDTITDNRQLRTQLAPPLSREEAEEAARFPGYPRHDDPLSFILLLEDPPADPNEQLTAVEVVNGFSELIRTGQAWSLQGSYGRAAASLIEAGYLSQEGAVLCYPGPDEN